MDSNSTVSLPHGYRLQGEKNEYVIDRVLGQGAFGITYLARYKAAIQGSMGKGSVWAQVAVKEFFMKDMNVREGSTGYLNEVSQDSLVGRYRRTFMREARNLASLHHPNIVNVFEVIEANNTVYIVMEYINGGSLDDHILKNGHLTEEESLNGIHKICSAISCMHNNKLLHLDIKPKNIMLDEDGEMYLIDFGLSKQYSENGEPESSTSIGLGTPGYAPIEQAEHHDGDKTFRATLDIYALGATLFKMLTGNTPPKASQVSDSVIDGNNIIAEQLKKAGISDGLISVVTKAMWPSSRGRYQTVDEFDKALNEIFKLMQTVEKSDKKDEKTLIVNNKEVSSAPSNDKIEETVVISNNLQSFTDSNINATDTVITPSTDKKASETTPKANSKLTQKTEINDSSKPKSKHRFYWWLIPAILGSIVFSFLLFCFIVILFSEDSANSDITPSTSVNPPSPAQQFVNTDSPSNNTPLATTTTTTSEMGSINGHEWVDLGLSVKWATCNVGASNPEGYGDYYAWGETNTKSSYTWVNYRFRTSGDSYYNVKFSKYNTDSSSGTVDNKSTLDLNDDVARVKWGGSWRMPTNSEFEELIDNCTWTWTTQNGINGHRVTSNKSGYTSRSIFLPAAGWHLDTDFNYAGSRGNYWSSSLYKGYPGSVRYLRFDSYGHSTDRSYRYRGQSVRPVCP